MAKRLPAKDVVIIGFGWTGAILGQELTDEGLDVVAIDVDVRIMLEDLLIRNLLVSHESAFKNPAGPIG